MIFVWQFTHPKGCCVVGDHLTYTGSKRSLQRLRAAGMYVGTRGNVALWKPEWSNIRRLLVIEDYDDAGVEGKLRAIVRRWRVFLKGMGRRISTTAVKYVFPQDLYGELRVLGGEENPTPLKVEAAIEIE